MNGAEIAAVAEGWVGVPFRWQGSVKAGCDCKGLIAGIAREAGRPEATDPELVAGDYGGKVDTRRIRATLERLFDRVPTSDRQPGDLLLLRLDGKAQHLAIYAPQPGKPDRAIEAMPSGPAKVRPARWPEHRIDSVWRWRD